MFNYISIIKPLFGREGKQRRQTGHCGEQVHMVLLPVVPIGSERTYILRLPDD